MAIRLVPVALFRGHWKALSDYRDGTPRPDKLTRTVLIAVPLLVFGLLMLPGAKLSAPGALLSGVALLAGSFLAGWGQVASLRSKLTERADVAGSAEQVDRDALDETSAHLLVAAVLSAAAALVLVLGMNFASDPTTGALIGVFAALAGGIETYVLILFIIAVPRLYTAYVSMHEVRAELSGTHRGR